MSYEAVTIVYDGALRWQIAHKCGTPRTPPRYTPDQRLQTTAHTTFEPVILMDPKSKRRV
jgi:hypothetical protein